MLDDRGLCGCVDRARKVVADLFAA